MSAATNNETETETTAKSGYYKPYKVMMHNDSKTPMNFVTMVLQRFYQKEGAEAERLMMEIHETGVGLAGVYPYESAEFRVDQTHSAARAAGFPLTCTIELA
jgi:ATP-dependent Clp protease adaptor protein ClpS